MLIKEFEGQEYVLKKDVDQLVAERVAEISTKKREAEARALEAEKAAKEAEAKAKTAEEAAAGAGALKAQLDEAQARAARSEGRYERHMALADKGITDADVRDAIEWAHERSQAELPKGQQQTLPDALDAWLTDPDKAPASVRPHLIAVAQAVATGDEQGGDAGAAGGDQRGSEGGEDAPKAQPRGRGALPQLPGQRQNKPTPNQPTLTLEQIYAADGDELDKMMEQFKAGST